MSRHIRMLNPMSVRGNSHSFMDCNVTPCDCAGPGGCNHYIGVPCKIHLIPR